MTTETTKYFANYICQNSTNFLLEKQGKFPILELLQ